MEVSPLKLLSISGYPHTGSQFHHIRSSNILLSFFLLPRLPPPLPPSAVRIPTPPWVKAPLRLQPHELENLSSNSTAVRPSKSRKPIDDDEKSDKALTAREGGARGEKAMAKIVRSIENLATNQNSVSVVDDSIAKKKMPWVKEEKEVVNYRIVKEKVATQAELVLDQELLEELRSEADKIRVWVKVKKLGVTQRAVDEIRTTWERNELARVKFDVPLCRNMDRAREIVEMKTGGLVVWSWKDSLVVYRGCNYQMEKNSAPSSKVDDTHGTRREDLSLFQREADRLLDELGPRFVDWWMPKPLPVDADLLPEVVAGYRAPLRRWPPYGRPQLEDAELTHLRKLARGLPTHFVLGNILK
ncbi:Chloroplastic group IIA intron splicing facilitator CRS1, chloroplastic, partial [Linum perenne]